MGTDYIKEKLDAESVPIPYPEGKRTRTCARCGQQWYVEEMVRMSDEKYYCKLCYDPPQFQGGPHARGDVS